MTDSPLVSSDADKKQSRPKPLDARFCSNSRFATNYLPPETRRGGSPHYKSPFPVRIQSSETIRTHAFRGQDLQVGHPLGLEMAPPYRFWSEYLSRYFNLRMYNEFRRLAIDELFTRHNDRGFNALMDFYRHCLLSPRRLPGEVISDMVNLSRVSIPNVHLYVRTVLTAAINGGQMELRNRNRARQYFDAVFGPKGRRSSDPLH